MHGLGCEWEKTVGTLWGWIIVINRKDCELSIICTFNQTIVSDVQHLAKMSKKVILAHSRRTTYPLHRSSGVNILIIVIKVYLHSPKGTARLNGVILGKTKEELV